MNARADLHPQAAHELTIKRIFDAPRERVFEAWTTPDQLNHWCCPKDFTLPHSQGDIRPGGSFKTCMRSPDGQDHWLAGTYEEIVPPKRIVFTHRWLDDEGRSDHETTVTVTLQDIGGKTKLTLHQAFFTSQASRDGHNGGWSETLDNLEEYLK